MKKHIFFLLLIVNITACSELNFRSYKTYQEAIDDGIIIKGWMPAYYPKSAKNIILATELDTNIFVIKSEIEKGNIIGFKKNCKLAKSIEEINYFDDITIHNEPSFLRFECEKEHAFVEILNEQYVFYSNNF